MLLLAPEFGEKSPAVRVIVSRDSSGAIVLSSTVSGELIREKIREMMNERIIMRKVLSIVGVVRCFVVLSDTIHYTDFR
mgnify:CR=1 FL=1